MSSPWLWVLMLFTAAAFAPVAILARRHGWDWVRQMKQRNERENVERWYREGKMRESTYRHFKAKWAEEDGD